jgi:DNA gyrase subunit A
MALDDGAQLIGLQRIVENDANVELNGDTNGEVNGDGGEKGGEA